MKTLKESLFDQDITSDEIENVSILKWLEEKYNGKFDINIKKHLVNSEYDVIVIDTSIKRLLPEGWKFDFVLGNFNCSGCENLESLEGAPKKITRDFDCSRCNSLIDLKGAPKYVRGFSCNDCKNLESLEGAPRKVKWDFNCGFCTKLKSLIGSPDEVDGDFICDGCKNLTSLEGMPAKVNGSLFCINCNIDKSTIDKKVNYSIFCK